MRQGEIRDTGLHTREADSEFFPNALTRHHAVQSSAESTLVKKL